MNKRELWVVRVRVCDELPSLIDELNEGQPGVLLNGVLPLLIVKNTINEHGGGVSDMD